MRHHQRISNRSAAFGLAALLALASPIAAMAQSIEGPDGDEQGSSPDPDVIPDDEELGPAFSGSTLSGRQESLSSAKVVPSGDDGDETGSPAETDETDGEEETEN